MSIIKHVTLQKIVAHDFRYDPRVCVYVCVYIYIYTYIHIYIYTHTHTHTHTHMLWIIPEDGKRSTKSPKMT